MKLLEDLFRNSGESKQLTKDRILARLQRKNNNLTSEQKYDVSERLDGIDLKTYTHRLKSCTEAVFVANCKKDRDFLLWVDALKGKKKGYYYSEKEDTLKETTRGYGNTEKPEDYLDAFAKYVNENQDKIEAIRIACTKPSDMTRAQLKELKLALDKENFTESKDAEVTIKILNLNSPVIKTMRKYAVDNYKLYPVTDWEAEQQRLRVKDQDGKFEEFCFVLESYIEFFHK